jgi:hypothetical protein
VAQTLRLAHREAQVSNVETVARLKGGQISGVGGEGFKAEDRENMSQTACCSLGCQTSPMRAGSKARTVRRPMGNARLEAEPQA